MSNVKREIILAKYGEIALKGLNKRYFEDVLVGNIRAALKPFGEFRIKKAQSTIFIYAKPGGTDSEFAQPGAKDNAKDNAKNAEQDITPAAEALLKVFGLGAVQTALETGKDFREIAEHGLPFLSECLSRVRTFKVDARRADKHYPMTSPEIMTEFGSLILEKYPHLTVDVHHPEVTVRVEIRDEFAYVTADRKAGAGGLPVGTSGKALLMLSGGFDSPVAGYMMAKRGLAIEAVHFESPPYTSPRARLKVEKLCAALVPYTGEITLHIVPFTEIQEALRDRCPPEYFTIIMRRLMLRIANKIAAERRTPAIITGESVGQVASQTLGALNCTDAVAEFPVFRPVIGMDKIEITAVAARIGTFDISAEPYEDCCTVFSPRHPKTKPTVREAETAEAKFDYSGLLHTAYDNITMKKM
ncbi:putative tRNA sulfurtransferase [Clostridia bacterium]|nr:putative tRNA sulfurtransferase [Clostridia bacterium]